MADGTIKILTDLSTEGFKAGLSKMGSLAKAGLTAVTTGIAAVSTALLAAGGYAVKVGSNFEAAMSEVSAISGAAGKDLQALTDKAKEMGSTTKFSATESAEALKYMAMAGWDTDKMLSGLPGVMNLAAASGENLGLVSDIVTDSMTAFGLSAEKSTAFADVLAQTANKSNTSIAMMGDTFKYVAPVAGALGYSVEDAAVAIGLMANSGIKGSQAGTALRSMLSRLAKPTDEVQGAMDDLGISLTDSEGNMKSFGDVVTDMRKGFKGLTQDQKAQYAASIAGQEGMSGLLAIVNASEEDFNALTESINNSSGASAQMAEVMQDNLQGAVTIAKSGLEGLGITVYEQVEAPLRQAVESGTGYINQLNEAFSHGLDTGVAQIGTVIASIAANAAKNAPDFLNAGTNLILAFCDGISGSSRDIARAGAQVLKTLVSSFSKIIPQIGKIGLELIKEFARQILGYKLGNQVDSLAKSILKAFEKIVSSVKRAASSVAPLLKNIASVALKAADTGVTVLASAVSFLCDNIKILVPVAAAVVTALIAWNIAQSVASSIAVTSKAIAAFNAAEAASGIAVAASTASLTAKQLVVGVLQGKIALATAAQYLWNASMFANPIGLVIAAVAALAVGIAALCLMQENEIPAEERLAESSSKLGESYGGLFDKIGEFSKSVSESKGVLDTLNQTTLSESVTKQQELADKITDCQNQITAIAQTASAERRALNDQEIESIRNLYAEMKAAKDQLLGEQQVTQEAVKIMAQSTADSQEMTAASYQEFSARIMNSAYEARDTVISTAEEQCVSEIANANYRKDTLGEISEAECQKLIDDAVRQKEERVAAAEAECNETSEIVVEGYATRAESAQLWADKNAANNSALIAENKAYTAAEKDNLSRLEGIKEKSLSEQQRLENNYRSTKVSLDTKHNIAIAKLQDDATASLDDATQSQLATFVGMVVDMGVSYGDMEGETKSLTDQMLATFKLLNQDSRDSMNKTMEDMGIEINEGGDLVYSEGKNAGKKVIDGWKENDSDALKAAESTVSGMSKTTGSSTVAGPSMGKIKGTTSSAAAARNDIQSYLDWNPVYQTVYTRSVSSGRKAGGGERSSDEWAKGGVTKYARGGVSPEIHKHAAGVFTKRTRLWDPVSGINEYGEAGHEALLPLKASVYNEIAKGIVQQLSPAKLSGMMSQLRAAVQSEMGSISLQMTAAPQTVQVSADTRRSESLDVLAAKLDAILDRLSQLANLTVALNGETVGRLVTPEVNARMSDLYDLDERGKF